MPQILNKIKYRKFGSIYQNLIMSPLNNAGMYFNYLQRAHKSGPHARPIYRGPFTSSIDEKTNKEKLSYTGRKDILAFTKMENWGHKFLELTSICNSPSVGEINKKISGVNYTETMEAANPLVLKRKGKPNVEIEELELDNLPKALVGGDLGYAILSQTEEEHDKRIALVKKHIDEINKVGIVEGSGRLRQYTCAYAGPFGKITTSEILIGFPELAEKCDGQPQYIKNTHAYNFLVKNFTPGNNSDQDYIRPDTDNPERYVDWDNEDAASVKNETAEEGIFTVSGAYTTHVANSVSFKLNNDKTIFLFTEAEMSNKYLVGKTDHELEEYYAAQVEIQSPSIATRMHEDLYLSIDADNSISGVWEEAEIQDLINLKVQSSGSRLYYVEHKIPNPLGAFGVALYMTCENGLPIGPYVAEGGKVGWGSNCVTFNHTIFLAGGGNLEDLYLRLSEDELTIASGGRDFAPYFLDGYLRTLKKHKKIIHTIGSTIGDYIDYKKQLKSQKGNKTGKEILKAKKDAAIDEILHGANTPKGREVVDKGIKPDVDDDGNIEASIQFIFLALNSVTYLQLKNRIYDELENYTDLSAEEREQESPEFMEMVDKVLAITRPKNEDKIVQILNQRNAVVLCAAAAILQHGLTEENESKERENVNENLPLSRISEDAKSFANETLKGNKPDVSKLEGNLPPKK